MLHLGGFNYKLFPRHHSTTQFESYIVINVLNCVYFKIIRMKKIDRSNCITDIINKNIK